MKKIFIIIIIFIGVTILSIALNGRINKNEIYNTENQNVAIENEVTLAPEEMYASLISDYSKALEEYDLENVNADDMIEANNKLVDTSLLSHIKRYEENTLAYTFYDIDQNGTSELIYGVSDEEYISFTPTSIYSYNTDEETIEKLYYTCTIERGAMEIYDNGVIFDYGAESAAEYYYAFGKIADDGHSFEMLEEVEEEYAEGKKDPIYRNASTQEELEYKDLDEITDKYLKGANNVIFEDIRK